MIILWVVDHTVGLRVTPGEEEAGLDLTEHGESAYFTLDPLLAPVVIPAATPAADSQSAPSA
jgi:hypothetical protein